ncbi:MAG: hypothetical protein PV340_03740 [Wolbachia sp.]|nr:hypothetical protein [Wolbachia sp.]
MQCTLVCTALMISTCFIVRIFNLREKSLKNTTHYSRGEIDKQFKKDSVVYHIFDKDSIHIKYNSLDQWNSLNSDAKLATFLVFPLTVLQSCIMLSFAVVEFLESVPSLFVYVFYDRKFESTKSNLQRSGRLFYAGVRKLIPISRFDEPIAEFIGIPKATCCSI